MAKKVPTTNLDKRRAARLKELFEKQKAIEPELTQKSLAADCELAEPTISRILSGELAISHSAAILLARRLNVHPGEFHDDFVDFRTAGSFKNAQAFLEFERLSDEDQETVAQVIRSLSD